MDCQDVPTNVTYSCEKPWGRGCTSHRGFEFASLWNFTEQIRKACPTDPRLFKPVYTSQTASLSQKACAEIVGNDMRSYPSADIWSRLTTWKFPLLQLVSSFPRPPLSYKVECFVLVHLMGDPVDTFRHLVSKLSICDAMAVYWKRQGDIVLASRNVDNRDRTWKALALITDAYQEWDMGKDAITALQPISYVDH